MAQRVDIMLVASTEQFDAAMSRAGVTSDVTAKGIGDSFTKGTSKAGHAITGLANQGAALGIPFSSSLAKIGKELDNATSKTTKFSKIVGEVGKLTLAGGAIGLVAVGVAAVKLADSYDKSHASLDAAIKASGSSLSAYGSQITAADKKMEKLGFTNAQTEAALALGTIASGNTGKAIGTMGLAADLARAKGIDLSTAMGIIDKALAGNLRGLTAMGISLPIIAASAEKLKVANQNVADSQARVNAILAANPGAANAAAAGHAKYESAVLQLTKAQYTLNQMSASSGQIIDALTQKLGGQANAWTRTFGGSITVLGASLQDMGKNLGQWLIPKLTDVANWMVKNEGKVKDLAIAIAGVLGMAVAVFVGQTVTTFIGGIGKMVSAIQGLILKMASASAASTVDFSAIGTEAQLAAEKEAASFTAADATIVTGNTGLLASFRAMALSAAAALAPLLIALGAVVTAVGLAVLTFKALHAAPTISTGNYQQALAKYTSTGEGQFGGPLGVGGSPTGKPMTPAQMATWEVAKYKADKAWNAKVPNENKLGKSSGVSPFDTSGVATPKTPKPAPGSIDPATGIPWATELATANGNAAGAGGSGSGSTKLTAAQSQLEVIAKQFVESLHKAIAGGTSSSQQGKTVQGLATITSGGNVAREASLVGSLNAANNPTLTALALTVANKWQSATTKLTTIVDSETTKGQSELQKLQRAGMATSIRSLTLATDSAAKTGYTRLVTELKATHQTALNSLAKQLEAGWKTATANLASIMANLTTLTSANTISNQAAVSGINTQASQQAGSSAVQVSGLGSTQTANRLAAAATSITDAMNISNAASATDVTNIKDAATLMSDASTILVSSINAQTTAMVDTANAQVSAIQDQTQTQVDTLAERGLYGLALQTQMAKVALDQQKALDDAATAAAQAHLDQVTAQTNQAVNVAKQTADQDQAVNDAAIAVAQMAELVTVQTNDASVAAAQASSDTVQITSAISIASAEVIAGAASLQAQVLSAQAAQLSTASQFVTGAAQRSDQAQSQLLTAQASAVTAGSSAALQAVENQTSMANQNAANALQQAQSAASNSDANMAANLSTIQNAANTQAARDAANLSAIQTNATTTQAQAQQQLTSIQTIGAVAEAKQQAQVNLLQEMTTVQFAGGGTVVNLYGVPANNAAAIGNAVDWAVRTATPAPIGS